MSAGTLTLTNNSALVSGAGTSFSTELAAGDFVVTTVGGIPYTLPVKTIESNTGLTLVSNFTGPTQSGAAWSAVPRVVLNMVTAALVTQSAEALRGLNYDKQNWQQFFTADGDVTITLPDTSQTTGPSAKKLINSVADKADKTALDGKADKTALDSYAKKGDNSDISSLSGLTTPLSLGQGGTGSTDLAGARVNLRVDSLVQNASQNWLYSPDRSIKLAMIDNNVWGAYSDALAKWVLPAGMVTDSNGYLKAASPVIRLKGDGSVEFNEEAEGVTAERISTGMYRVHGVMGFNADPCWGGINGGVTVPVDINNQPLIWVDFSVENNGDILLRTYHRTHPDAPEFARNLIGLNNDEGTFTESVKDGEPADIPDGRWVDLRIQMPEDSLWNRKQMVIREAMEKAEREREDNQQDVQS
ncbi:phage tail protein [Citrobacter sp. RHBSTW-00029]|uniref:phage tail fiber protein n=1 Tax=Citrobacter sp. RHBSTW-00029 TaxID=2742631 RepID=UPI0015FD1DD0|nr:phage tail protein [Citrobacter sp. RHBSTW-00029]MBA8106000.1 phage tail protein [Citrobacter sp. RHBSTW-00029]